MTRGNALMWHTLACNGNYNGEYIMGHTTNKETNTKNIGDNAMDAHYITHIIQHRKFML